MIKTELVYFVLQLLERHVYLHISDLDRKFNLNGLPLIFMKNIEYSRKGPNGSLSRMLEATFYDNTTVRNNIVFEVKIQD